MEAIFPFKALSRFKEYNKDKDLYFRVADLAVRAASKFYNTRLITDQEGADIFKKRGIRFNTVEILDSIEEYNGDNPCFPKIFSMLSRTHSYLMLDFDSILLRPILSEYESAFGFYEYNTEYDTADVGMGKYLFDTYFSDYFTNVEGKSDFIDKSTNWSRFPSMSLFYTNSPEKVSSSYSKLIDILGIDFLEKITPQLFEQHLFYCIHNTTNNYLQRLQKTPGYDIKDQSTFFVHLNSGVQKDYPYILPYLDYYKFKKQNLI